MLTRRTLALGAGAVAATAFVGVRLGRGQAAKFSIPLPVPPLIDVAKKGNACKLKAARGRHAFFRGKPTLTYGYSAPILGPVLRARRGDEVEVTVENALDVPTTVHWHGLLVPGEADGGPQQLIDPGRAWRPILKVSQPPATLWYHPHPHHDTGRQIWMGLAGMLIVSDDSDSRLGLPHIFGTDDLPLILQDRSFDSDGSLDYGPSPLDTVYGARGDTVIVNGAIAPFARVPAGAVRLRLLNAANAQNFELRFRDRRTFFVIASDAGFLPAPVPVTQLRISPAERFEILVDFADRKSVVLETGPDELMGMFGVISDSDSSPDGYLPIMRFEPTAPAPAVRAVPERLVEPAKADPARAVRRRQFLVTNGICRSRTQSSAHEDTISLIGINGKGYDPARVDVETELGTSEIWEVVSAGMAHPFHVHGASFRILSLKGEPPPAHLAGWKDVALVEDTAELLVAFNQPATREHPFMYHCHILEHEDAGVMGQYVCA
jgi:blue copper oxidase